MRYALLPVLLACTGKSPDTSDTGESGGTDSQAGGFDTSHNGSCSTGEEWTRGNAGSAKMNPGESCITCHDNGSGPTFHLAGTVMGAIHDPDDCNGISGVTVHVTDADGVVTDLSTNSAGNFYTSDRVKMPYTLALEYNGITRRMEGAQQTGDCASCHSQDGAEGAPGRSVVPY